MLPVMRFSSTITLEPRSSTQSVGISKPPSIMIISPATISFLHKSLRQPSRSTAYLYISSIVEDNFLNCLYLRYLARAVMRTVNARTHKIETPSTQNLSWPNKKPTSTEIPTVMTSIISISWHKDSWNIYLKDLLWRRVCALLPYFSLLIPTCSDERPLTSDVSKSNKYFCLYMLESE